MKRLKRIMALVIAMAMVLGMMSLSAFAETVNIAVTFNPNGGTGGGTATAAVEDSVTSLTVADVTTAIPDVVAPAGKSFDAWSASPTTKTATATIEDGKATFYAIWKDQVVGTNNLTLDTSLSISGLESGDKVNFYRVLEFSQDATTTGGWKAAEGFTGLNDTTIQKILGLGTYASGGANASAAGIDAATAGDIADMAEGATAAYANVAEASGTATVTNPVAPGLYVAIITPAQAGTVYNPVFVGADYKTETPQESSAWTVSLSPSYTPQSIAKKSKITLNKTASTTEATYEDSKPETVAAGDTVSFTVETTIPKFADNYTSAVFKVSDTLSKGLKLKSDTIKVFPGWNGDTDEPLQNTELPKTYADGSKNAYVVSYTTDGEASASIDDSNTTKDGYVISFGTDYLLNEMGNTSKKITIKYDAVVTTDAPTSINVENNTATVNFSNSPTDSTGKGILKDETKHYTFDIDGNILGQYESDNSTPWKAAEVVKVGLDKDGNEITQTTAMHGITEGEKTQKIGALEGAEFVLYTDSACTQPYTNDILTAGKKIISDSTGRLTIEGETTPGIRGLDAGTYYLKETKAPEGYIKAQDAVEIVINATITEHDVYEYYNNDGVLQSTFDTHQTTGVDGLIEVHYQVKELESYTITVGGKQTASYTWVTDKEDEQMPKGDSVVGADNAPITSTSTANDAETFGKITNTQGVELPSTGGIGTTIFYIVGTMLVLGAGVVLITRRRMDA